MKILEITRNTSGKVRDRLCMEDVFILEWEVLEGFGLAGIEMAEGSGEEFLWFKESVRVPKFNKFYASRITSVKDDYFVELVNMLLYLNPKPDQLGIKKLTEFIILRFSKMQMQESQVKVGEQIAKPVLTFEDVEPAVSLLATMVQDYVPDNETPVLFSRDSKLTREQKTSIVARYRGQQVKERLEGAIHIAAEHLIDTKEYLKITNSKLKNTGMITTSKGVASLNTIGKYMGGRTRRIIGSHNEAAPFKSEKTRVLFKKFLMMPEGSTLHEVCVKLSVSKSTVLEFRKLAENEL